MIDIRLLERIKGTFVSWLTVIPHLGLYLRGMNSIVKYGYAYDPDNPRLPVSLPNEIQFIMDVVLDELNVWSNLHNIQLTRKWRNAQHNVVTLKNSTSSEIQVSRIVDLNKQSKAEL